MKNIKKSKTKTKPNSQQKRTKILKRTFRSLFILSMVFALVAGVLGSGIDIVSFFIILSYVFSAFEFSVPYFYKSMESALLASSLLAIFVSPMFIYDIVLLIRILGTKNLAVVADSNTWIGFAGSIIGGCITMLALLFTLKHDAQIRLRDKSIAVMPILTITPVQSDSGNMNMNKLSINNISENIATKIDIISMKSFSIEFSSEFPGLHSKNNEVQESISEYKYISSPLQGKSSYQLNFKFPTNRSCEFPQGISYEIVIRYKDILDLKTYYTIFYVIYSKESLLKNGYTIYSTQNNSFDEASHQMIEYNINTEEESNNND